MSTDCDRGASTGRGVPEDGGDDHVPDPARQLLARLAKRQQLGARDLTRGRYHSSSARRTSATNSRAGSFTSAWIVVTTGQGHADGQIRQSPLGCA